MADNLESQIEEPVVEAGKRFGYKVRKVQWVGSRNAPDRLFFRPGRAFFIEFKAPGEKPRPAQDREIRRLRAAGLPVYVVDSVESGLAVLEAEDAHA